MKKRFFLVALSLGASLLIHAQATDEQKKQIVNSNHDQFMTELQSGLVRTEDKNPFSDDFKKAGDMSQFFLEKSKVPKFVGSDKDKDKKMKNVYKKLKNKKIVSDFTFEGGNVKKIADNSYKTTTKVHVVAKTTIKEEQEGVKKKDRKEVDVNSDATFDVEIMWKVTPNTKEKDLKKGKLFKSTEIVSLSVKQGNNNDEIIRQRKESVEKAIKQWYENEAVAAVTEEVNKDYLVVATPKPTYTKVNVSGVKANSNSLSNVEGNVINVSVDPAKFIKEGEEYLYTNSGASVDVTPKFAIEFDNNNNASVTVSSYSIKENKPVANEIMVSQKNNAFETCDNFKNKLQSFVQNKNDKKLKQEIISMFADKKAKVFTSTVIDDKELPIKERSVEQYLNSLKAESINIKVDADMKGDINDPVFEFSQNYQGGNYCDNTIKQIQLHWDGEKYVINNVVVEKGKTTPCVK